MGGSDPGQPCKNARDAIELCPNDALLPRVLIPEGLAIEFGRSLFPSMQQTFISRQHCQLYWKTEPVLRITPGKRAMAITTAGHVQVLESGASPGEVCYCSLMILKHLVGSEHEVVVCR